MTTKDKWNPAFPVDLDFRVHIQSAAAEQLVRAQQAATRRAIEYATAHGATVNSSVYDSVFVEWREDPPAEVLETFKRILLGGEP